MRIECSYSPFWYNLSKSYRKPDLGVGRRHGSSGRLWGIEVGQGPGLDAPRRPGRCRHGVEEDGAAAGRPRREQGLQEAGTGANERGVGGARTNSVRRRRLGRRRVAGDNSEPTSGWPLKPPTPTLNLFEKLTRSARGRLHALQSCQAGLHRRPKIPRDS